MAINEKCPFVTAMIVVRNEEDFIEECLDSLLDQDYPKACYEIIVIDGMSTDGTRKNVLSVIENHMFKTKSSLNIKVIDNPKLNLASGWNLAIENAKGKYVVRLDAHAKAYQDFISKSVETIENCPEDVACVGGLLITSSKTEEGKVIARVLSSPFGVGNSKFRYSTTPQFVDTVAFGLYKKSVFTEVGLFNESLQRNQDNEMHFRISEKGYRFFLNPQIKSVYYSRATLKSMRNQGYQNGIWTLKLSKKNFGAMRLRHFIPVLFLSSILILIVLTIINPVFILLLIFELFLYFGLAIFFASKDQNRITNVFKQVRAYFILHIAYGAGTLSELLKFYK